MRPAAVKRKPNRLSKETSPYLLQHAYNPVHWYPWGKQAFRQATRHDKPVFLSVGYSTCHYCHVMERESFQHEDVARLLNEHFIAIKVDREERPDVDEIYMAATQLMTGQGGWPNSVWLTPEGKPWFAGTYFPREYRLGRPGFKTILTRLAELWRTRRKDVEEQAEEFAQAVRQVAAGPTGKGSVRLTADVAKQAVESLRVAFDKRYGGFGGEPKFPPHGYLRLLLAEYQRRKDKRLLGMVTATLDAMARGGMHDHLGGGFHRYAIDRQWRVPHFEKMLYDNAQLARIYLQAHALTGNEPYRQIAEGVFEWVEREMTDPAGGFYSALAADSEGREGKFYLWSYEEILEALGQEDGALFYRAYNVEKEGNFRDEAAGEEPGMNVLHLARPLELTAKAEKIEFAALGEKLRRGRSELLRRRSQRVRPHLDDKVLASWNGLMIASLAYAGRQLNEPRYVRAAEKAANFILAEMRKDGRLLRTWRGGQARLKAYLDDYAFLAEALLELHEAAPGQGRWLEEAAALTDVLIKHYRHPQGGFFLTADDHENLLARPRSPFDQATPAGNGTAASVLVRLGRLTGRKHYLEEAGNCLSAFWALVRRTPQNAAGMVLAAGAYLDEAASSGQAQEEAEEPQWARSQNGPVSVEAFASARSAAAGETFHVTVRLAIDEGWHVYAHQPLQGHLPPTSVRLVGGTPAEAGEISYPAGRKVRPRPGDEPILVYEGTVEIKVPVTIAADAPSGPGRLLLRVDMQACDKQRCLAPQTHELAVPIEVAGPRG